MATYFIIGFLAFISGYCFAISHLASRISFDRFVMLERLYYTSKAYLTASEYDDIEMYGDQMHKLVNTLGGNNGYEQQHI